MFSSKYHNIFYIDICSFLLKALKINIKTNSLRLLSTYFRVLQKTFLQLRHFYINIGSTKEILQKFRKIHIKNTFARVSFSIKLQPEACNFIKKETLAQVFSCEFGDIFQELSILQNSSGRLQKVNTTTVKKTKDAN